MVDISCPRHLHTPDRRGFYRMYDFVTDPLKGRDYSMGEPRSIGSLDGKVSLHIDLDAFDFHITAKPDHDRRILCDTIQQAEWWGLELLDEDECTPELLPDGSTRIYLTPIVPVSV